MWSDLKIIIILTLFRCQVLFSWPKANIHHFTNAKFYSPQSSVGAKNWKSGELIRQNMTKEHNLPQERPETGKKFVLVKWRIGDTIFTTLRWAETVTITVQKRDCNRYYTLNVFSYLTVSSFLCYNLVFKIVIQKLNFDQKYSTKVDNFVCLARHLSLVPAYFPFLQLSWFQLPVKNIWTVKKQEHSNLKQKTTRRHKLIVHNITGKRMTWVMDLKVLKL